MNHLPEQVQVVCCNDSVELVVIGDDDFANEQLERLAKAHFDSIEKSMNYYGNDPHFVQYLKRYFWHTHETALVADPSAGDPDKPRAINIVFDDAPAPNNGGQFVDVETDDGKSINIGAWSEHEDGYWRLRIDSLPETRPTETPPDETIAEVKNTALAAGKPNPNW